MERFFDVTFSSLALLVLFPLLGPVALILKFTGEGEIFFKQQRFGGGSRKFNLYKFATMIKNSPNIGSGTVTMRNDPRILPFGRFLRRTKINELPQLFNILIGDMSIVGPRPLTPQTFGAYSSNTQEIIMKVRPGLSGIGSIIFRSEEDIMNGESASVDFYNNVIAPYKGSLEEWFVANKGLYIYFTVIVITAWTVLLPSSQVAWKVFKGLPEPPDELKRELKYPV